jgi:hypothetical protein
VPSLAGAGIVVGVAVDVLVRRFAGAECRALEQCTGLVQSLALRMGVAVAVATVLVGLMSVGLFRTAEQMEADRRELADERQHAGPGADRTR